MDIEIYPKQYEALKTEAKEILYGGAAGSGKSYLMRYAAIMYCLYVPGIEVYLFRRKFNDLFSNHMYGPNGLIAILDPWVKAGKVAINLSGPHINFFHGGGVTSKIFLRHVQHDSDMYNYQGAEIHVLMIDELTHFSKEVYNFLRSRLRTTLQVDYKQVRKSLPFIYDGYFPRIISGTNPGGRGHAWVKRSFIDPVPPMDVWKTPKEEGGMDRIFIPALLSDNTKLLEADPDYAERLHGLGDANLVKAMLEGSWEVASGAALESVWDSSKQVLEPFEIPDNAYIRRGFDMGTYHPYAICWVMETTGEEITMKDGSIRHFPVGSQIVIREIYGWNGNENQGNRKTAYEIGREIAEVEYNVPWGDLVRKGPADGMIFDKRGGTSDTVEDHIVRGYNDYMFEQESGHAAEEVKDWNKPTLSYSKGVSELFSRADQTKNSRVQGLNILLTYMNSSKLDDGRMGLYFFNTCRHIIRTFPTIPLDPNKLNDVDTKSEDHCFAGETIVNTEEGPVRIDSLVGKSGKVFSENGTLQDFYNCKDYGEDNIYRYSMGDGGYIDCTEDHEILTEFDGFVEIQEVLDRGLRVRKEEVPYEFTYEASFITVKGREWLRKDNVYCITVEDTHSFSVNGGYIVSNYVEKSENTKTKKAD